MQMNKGNCGKARYSEKTVLEHIKCSVITPKFCSCILNLKEYFNSS